MRARPRASRALGSFGSLASESSARAIASLYRPSSHRWRASRPRIAGLPGSASLALANQEPASSSWWELSSSRIKPTTASRSLCLRIAACLRARAALGESARSW